MLNKSLSNVPCMKVDTYYLVTHITFNYWMCSLFSFSFKAFTLLVLCDCLIRDLVVSFINNMIAKKLKVVEFIILYESFVKKHTRIKLKYSYVLNYSISLVSLVWIFCLWAYRYCSVESDRRFNKSNSCVNLSVMQVIYKYYM